MNDRQVQGAKLSFDAAARREQILEHETKRNFVLGKSLLADLAHTVGLFFLFQEVDDAAAASFFFPIEVTAYRFGLLARFGRDLFSQTEVERIDRACLNAKGLLVFADPVAAHGAFGGFVTDIAFGDHLPRTGVDAVFAADASFLIDDDRTFFIFCNCLDRADRGAGGKIAMHAAVARP